MRPLFVSMLFARVSFVLAVLVPMWGACTFDPSGLAPDPGVCGNGVKEGTEYCDQGDFGGANCATLNLGGGTLACTASCTLDTSGCDLSAICGNGVKEGGEQCDDGNTADGDGCSHDCVLEVSPTCGDGVVDSGEECDDGNNRNDDACLNNCHAATCGDGYVQLGVETCEPNTLATTCVGLGYLSGNLACRVDCLDYDTTDCLREDGQDCWEDWQCDGGICFKEDEVGWSAGFCSRDCGSSGTCPGDGDCLTVENQGDRCFQPCTTPADCRQGYGCFDPSDLGYTICWPHCESDAQCPLTGTCNTYLNRCDMASEGSGAFGDACEDRTDCLGWCLASVGDGYCTARCKLSTGLCPSGAVCTNAFNSTHGDEGLCLKSCTPLGFDCRGGQTCQERYGQDVCWPVM